MSAGGSKVMIPLATKGQSATDCPGVLAGDTSKTKMGLVVLQEWWGLNEQIQEAAQDLSARGPFVTIVPDLYRGKVTLTCTGIIQQGLFCDCLLICSPYRPTTSLARFSFAPWGFFWVGSYQ